MVGGEDQSSEWGTSSLSCLLDIHVVIRHKQLDIIVWSLRVRLGLKKQT